MRNVFDQYSQYENRLTHALATCLAEDKKLLKNFLRWITGKTVNTRNLQVVEQRLPGEPELTEEEFERRGLPDIWIHDNEGWSLIVENKVSSPLKNEQLRRHYQTAVNRDFKNIIILVICAVGPKIKLPHGVVFKKWSDIYSWLHKQTTHSSWADRALKYMEIIESKWPEDGYLKEGTLTQFSGIPFTTENPYNYLQAKRVLKLAMAEFKKNRHLHKVTGIAPELGNRGAITGKDGVNVWDFFRLRQSQEENDFTKYPHFTLSIRRDDVYALVSIPNNMKREFKRNIHADDMDQFFALFQEIHRNLMKVVRKTPGAVPWLELLQRHYRSQRSIPMVDARLTFDLRTAFKSNIKGIKNQPLWLDTTFESLTGRGANMHLGVGVSFPYSSCPDVNEPGILESIANTWIGCMPLIESAIGKQTVKTGRRRSA